jgi:hypothetical protein
MRPAACRFGPGRMGTCRLPGLNVLIESEYIARVAALLDVCQTGAALAKRVAGQFIAVCDLSCEIEGQVPFACVFPGPTPGQPGPYDDIAVIHRVTPDGEERRVDSACSIASSVACSVSSDSP